mmetsp:Transcript_49014/g.129570  ORF Transcript_49014/g.129570 Transcript_49014/m.129570 type:complete len:109 (+) Transcript_49014:375-701(+)
MLEQVLGRWMPGATAWERAENLPTPHLLTLPDPVGAASPAEGDAPLLAAELVALCMGQKSRLNEVLVASRLGSSPAGFDSDENDGNSPLAPRARDPFFRRPHWPSGCD